MFTKYGVPFSVASLWASVRVWVAFSSFSASLVIFMISAGFRIGLGEVSLLYLYGSCC
jgi:hypothetical protein